MVAPVWGDFSANGEALDAEIEVRALGAFDPYLPGNVLITVVAVVKRLLAPSLACSSHGRRNGVSRIPARRYPPPLRPATSTRSSLRERELAERNRKSGREERAEPVAGVVVAGIRHPAGPPHRAPKP